MSSICVCLFILPDRFGIQFLCGINPLRQVTPYEHHSDGDLVKLLGAGDERAFEAIYRRHARGLFAYVRKNIYIKQECEEIIQEIFESLWSRRRMLSIKSTLQAYLLGMARHMIIRYFRRNALKRKYYNHFLLFETVYDQVTNPDQLDPSSIHSALVKLINELPERCREALTLRLSENLSNRDIAKRMQINTRTVETYMLKAFNHIRSSYRKYAANEG